MTITMTWAEQCSRCQGTGLYHIGIGERLGAAAVCRECQGTGELKKERAYTPFAGKKPPPQHITRVYAHNLTGHVISPSTPGGVDVEQWQQDPDSVLNPGAELRHITCPQWWYGRTMPPKPPGWDECIKAGMYENCPSFALREKCWERWDQENTGQQESPGKDNPYMFQVSRWDECSRKAVDLGMNEDAFAPGDEVLLVWKRDRRKGYHTLSRVLSQEQVASTLKLPL